MIFLLYHEMNDHELESRRNILGFMNNKNTFRRSLRKNRKIWIEFVDYNTAMERKKYAIKNLFWLTNKFSCDNISTTKLLWIKFDELI